MHALTNFDLFQEAPGNVAQLSSSDIRHVWKITCLFTLERSEEEALIKLDSGLLEKNIYIRVFFKSGVDELGPLKEKLP